MKLLTGRVPSRGRNRLAVIHAAFDDLTRPPIRLLLFWSVASELEEIVARTMVHDCDVRTIDSEGGPGPGHGLPGVASGRAPRRVVGCRIFPAEHWLMTIGMAVSCHRRRGRLVGSAER